MNASPLLHPTDQTLQAYGLGKLDDASAAPIDTHLETCEDCRRRVTELSGDSFLGRLRAGAVTAPDAPMNGRAAEALPEELLSQYELVRELGRGGMGVVWLARNKLLDRLEALKILNKAMLERRGTLDRFLREIRVVAQLSHENVVRAYSALQVGDALVFVLEYVEGMDLARLVKQRGPLPVAHACYFAHQAALGLQHAHERGMVHRDIKPGNLILHKQGQRAIVKVLDFGLAKALSEQSVDGSLTHEGQMLGTPDYIAPEQTVDAQNADIRADIYSLGCTLYYLLSGAPPFSGTSLYDLLQAHHSMDARPLNLLRPEVPAELAAAVGKMMAKDPARRFQTPAEVAKAMTPFFKKTAAPAQPPTEATPPAVAPTPLPATLPDSENAWRSLIDFEKPERVAEPPATPAPASTGRGTPRRWPLVAAAAGFGAVLLGIVITLSIRKDKDGATIGATFSVTPEPGAGAVPTARPVAAPKSASGPAEIGAGRWSVLDGELRLTLGPPGSKENPWYYLTFGNPDWSHYNFTFEANRNGGTDAFGALFHWLGPNHNRSFNNGAYAGTGSELRDHYPVQGTPPYRWHRKPHLAKSRPSERHRWYRVRVEVRDVAVRCYLDDELLFEDTEPRFSHGKVGLAAWNTPARFRNIKVTTPTGEVLWEGLPALPADAAFQPGSVWLTHKPPNSTLDVLERQGERFKARVLMDGTARDVQGTVRDGTVRWRRSDVVVVEGTDAGHDNEGTIHEGNEIFMNWSGGGQSGTYTLHLRNDEAPAAEAPSTPAASTAAPGNPAAPQGKPGAPADTVSFADKRYKVFRDELAWYEARTRCAQLGGRLAVVASADENRFIATLVKDAGLEHAWLGATDVAKEGRWLWVDGTPLVYNAWDRGQPNNHSPEGLDEHYAALIASRGVWWDQPDTAQRGWHPGFVCQWVDTPKPATARAPSDGFVSLFNGKDLTGWTTHPAGTGRWTVEDGAIVGRGPGQSHLFTARSDYTDFHARIEAKINAPGNGGFCFRSNYFGAGTLKGHGYEANIDNSHPEWRTGSLMHFGPAGQCREPLVKPDEWFTMDIVAVGKRIIIKINGFTKVDFVDPSATYREGRLALQQLDKDTVASYRKVEIKDLSRDAGDWRGDYATLFTAKDPVGWEGLPIYWRWRDGMLLGAPVPSAPAHTFLCSKRKFRDFELRFRVRRENGTGNSGVQFRSTLIDRATYKVRGPQCEICGSDAVRNPPGSMVMEAVPNARWLLAPHETVARVYRDTDYNDFLIRCVGKHVTIRINGATTVDDDYADLPAEGIIAWQMHGKGPATVEFRDVVLLDLSSPPRKAAR